MEHLFDIEVAREYGVSAAVVIRHLQFWIIKNKAGGRNHFDGRTWSYFSVQHLTKVFPYWSVRQIRTVLDNLVDAGVVVKGNYNKVGYDRTTWWAFQDESRFVSSDKWTCQKGRIEQPKKAHQSDQSGGPIPNTTPNKTTDNNPNQGLNSSNKKVLGLNDEIDQAKEFLLKRLDLYLKRYYTKNSPKTLAGIIAHFCHEAQKDPTKLAWFKDAVEWAAQASRAAVPNKVGLFVKKVKEQTTYRGAGRLLRAGILQAVDFKQRSVQNERIDRINQMD